MQYTAQISETRLGLTLSVYVQFISVQVSLLLSVSFHHFSLVSDDMAEQLVDILQDKQLFLCMNYTKDTMEGGMRVSTSRRSMEKKAKSSKALVRMSLLLELVAKQVPVRYLQTC